MFPRIFTKDFPFLSSHSRQKIAIFGMSIPSWSSGQANAWLLLARCHLAAKNHDEAQMSCREAHALCEETKNFQQELEVWQQVGRTVYFSAVKSLVISPFIIDHNLSRNMPMLVLPLVFTFNRIPISSWILLQCPLICPTFCYAQTHWISIFKLFPNRQSQLSHHFARIMNRESASKNMA